MTSRRSLPAPWSKRSRTVFLQSRKDGWIQNDMIAKMIELIPAKEGPFRNIFPAATHEWFRQYERAMLERINLRRAWPAFGLMTG